MSFHKKGHKNKHLQIISKDPAPTVEDHYTAADMDFPGRRLVVTLVPPHHQPSPFREARQTETFRILPGPARPSRRQRRQPGNMARRTAVMNDARDSFFLLLVSEPIPKPRRWFPTVRPAGVMWAGGWKTRT